MGSILQVNSIGRFVLLSVVFALLQTFEQMLRARVALATRLSIKRLVMERILYSEVGSLQTRYEQAFGEAVRTEQLEARVFDDINETLHLFNHVIPTIARGVYAFAMQCVELYAQRANIDLLSIVRPTVVGVCGEVVNLGFSRVIDDQQLITLQVPSASGRTECTAIA
jgi:hypothetical protein